MRPRTQMLRRRWQIALVLLFAIVLGVAIGSAWFDWSERHGVTALPWLVNDFKVKP